MTNHENDGEIELYTVEEVAKRWRVSKMTVYRLVHKGELPAMKVGSSFRVYKWAVQQYEREGAS